MKTSKTILEQLGGNKFIAMTGSSNFTYDSKNDIYLSMKLAKNVSKANYLTITLTPMDTYKMEFTSVRTKNWELERKVIATIENVYCDQLSAAFTKVTGMYTSLGTMSKVN